MADEAALADSLKGLANTDPKIRENSAEQIYRRGKNLCLHVLNQWTTDPQFQKLLSAPDSAIATSGGHQSTQITVGVAVQPETFEKIRSAHDSPRLADVPPDQDAREFELHFSRRANLDILTTRDPAGAGAIARYLQKFGEGIQQVEIGVSDVTLATEILKKKFAVQPIYPATRPGADGTRVNFFLVTAPDGKKILMELVEGNDSRP